MAEFVYHLAFYLMAIAIVVSALAMIFARNVVAGVTCLVGTFLGVAGIFFLLNAEFIGVVQIMVYAGGLSLLIVFAIMLTDPKDHEIQRPQAGNVMMGAVVSIVLFLMMVIAISTAEWSFSDAEPLTSQPAVYIGIQYFTTYIVPFYLAAIILSMALTGAIVMAKKDEGDEKC
ncbi:NADH-quinone oxidoreductase subunit J family protein [Desulfurispira natronophila]|uniref:NADH-quinone oxidoreductase subunit J n=1 Tax=Desulfurispira natronophila TaxID=682562 RepID=A0A7W8DHG2_9BACT|nr:NADH-quinone oxidoreductase subunit J [Desulfurispira natronophila]MBB5022455.1 NADH:ubiquinone oxidoreductase subunit 6 (subunit J) [Desulfurispira natronophila]